MFRISAGSTEAPTLRAVRAVAPSVGRIGVRQVVVASGAHLLATRPSTRIAAIAACTAHTEAVVPQAKSQVFSRIAKGLGGIVTGMIGAAALWEKANQTEETVRPVKAQSDETQKVVTEAMGGVEEHHPGRRVGLVDTFPLKDRDEIDQAEQYSAATKDLYTSGVTGRRLTDDHLTGARDRFERDRFEEDRVFSLG